MTPFRFAVLIGICVTWGMHFSVIKSTVGLIPPLAYVTARMGLVAFILSPFLKWHQGRMGMIVLAGACLGALNYAFLFSGLQYLSASLAAVLIELYVPIATVLSVLFLKERIGWKRILGLVLTLSGVLIIVTGGGDGLSGDNIVLGSLLIVGGAFVEAAGAIAVKRLKGITPQQMLAWFALIGTLTMGTLSAIFEEGQVAAFTGPSQDPLILALLYSVILASIGGHSAYYWLLQRVDVSQVAGGGVLTTVFAVAFGVMLMGDPLTVRFVLGALITLVGVAIIAFRSAAVARDKDTEPFPVDAPPAIRTQTDPNYP